MTKNLKAHSYREYKRINNLMRKLHNDLKTIDKLDCMEIIDVVIFSELTVWKMLSEVPEPKRSIFQSQWWNNVTELTRPSTNFDRMYLSLINGIATNVTEDVAGEILGVALKKYGIGGDEDKALENFKLNFVNRSMNLKIENLVEIYLETRERVRHIVNNLKVC